MSSTHITSAKAYFHQIYFEACDLLHGELKDRFNDKHIPSVLTINKNTLINAENGHDYEDTMEELKKSCYKDDVDIPTLARHLQLLQNVIKQCNPEVKKITSIQTFCQVMNKEIFKEMLLMIHQLLCIFNNPSYLRNIRKDLFCIKTYPNFYEIDNDRDEV